MHHGLAVTAVTASVGAVCLVLAALFWIVGSKRFPRVVVALVISGMAGIYGSTVGAMVHHWVTAGVTFVNSWTLSLIGASAGFGFALWVAYQVGEDVYSKKINTKTLGAAALVPVSTSIIPGSVGAVLSAVVAGLAGGVGWVVGALFGIH